MVFLSLMRVNANLIATPPWWPWWPICDRPWPAWRPGDLARWMPCGVSSKSGFGRWGFHGGRWDYFPWHDPWFTMKKAIKRPLKWPCSFGMQHDASIWVGFGKEANKNLLTGEKHEFSWLEQTLIDDRTGLFYKPKLTFWRCPSLRETNASHVKK